ncbi:MAG: PQQ-binding-like beta-propeller repeat protein [Phycisphaeraceae bacterium]
MLPFSLRPLVCIVLLSLMMALPTQAQNPNVTIDDQPTAEQKLEEVLELRRAKRYAEAAELIQELIASAQFKLVALGDGTYADAGRWASDVLLRDSALRQAYSERYNAVSARLLEQAKASDQPLPALLEVYRSHGATSSGLAAGMDAAGLLLEAGEARSAASLVAALLRHPNRAEAMARLEMLRGAAAAYMQDGVQLDEAAEALAELDAELVEQLKGLAASIEPTTIAEHPSQIDMGPKPISIRAPLWDQTLATADNAQRWLQDDKLVTPSVTPSLVLFSNGRQVVALDRASGQRAWVVPEDDNGAVQKVITSQRWSDQRGVARGQGKIAAVLGECYGITERRNPFVPPNSLVCVDEQTGKMLWQRTSGEFRDDEPTRASDRRAGRLNLQNTHFVGTPMLSQGSVFAILRRANSEGDTQSSWLLAYDAASGSLLWYRHLALVSMSYTNADSLRVTPHLMLNGETIYFSNSLGTVGAIDRNTGGYRWLRVLPVGSANTKSLVASTRGVTSGPVMTSAGLLVPLSLSGDRLLLVDPDDGSVLRSFKEDPKLGKTQYLLETSGGALAVSQTAVSYWDADKATVAWTFPFVAGETLRGRGDVSLRFAVLPTSQRLLVLDLATGKLLDEAPAIKGSVVVRDSEVVAVSEGRVHAYTSWERVYKRLVEQVESRPNDPTAGLSLAMIAMRQEDQQASVLQGVGHALEAVGRQPLRRQAAVASHVFEQLRALIPQTDEPELRAALYQRLAMVTQTATQEAAYHLDAGFYFAGLGDTRQAIDHLHAVIAEPAFASATYDINAMSRPAGTVAQQEIQRLIDQYGRGVYARQDAMAQASVDEIKAQPDLDPAALATVARRFPLSPVAGQLLLDAADARFAEQKLIGAASLYKQAVLRAVGDEQAQLAAGRLLRFYIETGRPVSASAFLDRLDLMHPGIQPLADDQPLAIEQWRERIAKLPARTESINTLAASMGTPVLLKGKLIAAAQSTSASELTGRLYLYHANNTITCRDDAQPGRAVWTASIPASTGPVELLADHHEQVVFWMPADARVIAIDAQSGAVLWQTSLRFSTTDQAQNPNALASGPPLLTVVSETVICIGHRDSAEVIAIDRAIGSVLWRTKLEMTALTALDADDWSLVAVGRAGHPQQLRSGKLYMLSLTDAQPMIANGSVRIALTPFGVHLDRDRITVLGSSGVMALRAPDGRTLWSKRMSQQMLTGTYAIANQRIAVQTNDGEVHLLDAANQGKSLGSVLVSRRGNINPTKLSTVAGQLWCQSNKGVFRFGQDKLLDWSDAMQQPDLSPRQLVVGSDHVALIATQGAVDTGFELILFDGEGGRLVSRYNIGPLDAPNAPTAAQHFGSGLALALGDRVMIIPPATPDN